MTATSDPAPAPRPDHRAVLAAIPAERRADLSRGSDAAGLWHLAGHLGAIALVALWVASGGPLWWLALPVLGLLLTFLFTLEHECTHGTPFATPALSLWVGRVAGAVLVLPFTWFRWFHMAHHRHTNDPGRDPELATPKPEGWRAIAWHVSGLPYWAAQISLVLRLARGRADDDFLPPRARPVAIAEARAMLAAYLLALASLAASPAAFWLWVVPMVLGQPALRLYLLAEHADCPHVADMLHNTRTTFTTTAMRWLAWNMPYHIEHHSAPQVPFHRLPDLHDDMRAHLGMTAPGYAAFTRGYLSRHGARP